MAGSGKLGNYHFARDLSVATPAEVLYPPKLITGHDLIKLGLNPGPLFREILEEVAVLQLEGKLTNRDMAFAHVETLRLPPANPA
jgi:poly(A) polymerase